MGENRQVVYDLDRWSADQRGELVALLAGQGIAHHWRTATTLVVTGAVEPAVDGLLRVVGGEVETHRDGTKRPADPTGGVGRPAPLGLRLLAFVMDAMLTSIAWYLAIGSAASESSSGLDVDQGLLIGLAVLGAYYIGFVSIAGRTPGKMAVKIRVADVRDGSKPSVVAATARFAVPYLGWGLSPILGVSWLDEAWVVLVYGTVLTNARHLGLHDLAAGTIVVSGTHPPDP